MKEFTIKEAAEYLNKSESWIRKKILSNELQASKKPFKYGQRYKITKKALDELQNHIQAEREVIELAEIDKPISKEVILNELTTALNEHNKALIDEAVNSIDDKLDRQESAIKKQNKAIDEQQETIKSLVDEIKELKELQQRTLFDKIKDIFIK